MAAGADVARVLHLAEVAFPEGPPDLIPPQQRRPRALRPRRLAVHHSQTHARRIAERGRVADLADPSVCVCVCRSALWDRTG